MPQVCEHIHTHICSRMHKIRAILSHSLTKLLVWSTIHRDKHPSRLDLATLTIKLLVKQIHSPGPCKCPFQVMHQCSLDFDPRILGLQANDGLVQFNPF